jgi:esterase
VASAARSPSQSDADSRSAIPRSTPTESSVRLGDWVANIARWGRPDGEPVLLLHGFTAHARTWDALAAALGPSFDVVALDQRGHGLSGPTDEFGSRPMVRDIEQLLAWLGWSTATIVGQSMGGMNAFLFDAAHPGQVDRLVIVDIGPEIDPAGASRIQSNVRQPDVFASFDEALAEARRLFPLADAGLLVERVRHNLIETDAGSLTWRTDRRLRDGSAQRDDHTVEERWSAWRNGRAPLLLVHGTESDILTPPLVERLVDARPDVTVVGIEGAGHAVPLDQPEALASAVTTFLASDQ